MTEIRPPTARKGPFLYTATGDKFWPLDPRPEDVRIEAIAIHLSRVPRFAGASGMVIAQHSVEVSRRLPEHLALQGLFHDAPEFIIGDNPRPIKRLTMIQTGPDWRQPGFQSFHEIEGRILDAISQAVGFRLPLAPEVHEVDLRMFATEARDLVPGTTREDLEAWGHEPYPTVLEAWPRETACEVFLDRYQEIAGS